MTIPKGFTTITPYLTFNNTSKAIEFYGKALGAEEIMRFPSESGGVMYAEVKIGNSIVMMGDANPVCGNKSSNDLGGSPVSFYVYVDDIEQAFQNAKDAGMKEEMPLKDMPWGDRMGTLSDDLGYQWTLAQHIKDVSPEEVQAAMAAGALNG